MSESVVGKSVLSIELEHSLDELARLRDFCRDVVEEFATGAEVDEVVAKLQLAATEAVTNIIRHGSDSTQQPIVCQAKSEDSSLNIEIHHHGQPFQPEGIPDVQEPLEGGMGLFLIDQCVDRVFYFQKPDGRQCVRLIVNNIA